MHPIPKNTSLTYLELVTGMVDRGVDCVGQKGGEAKNCPVSLAAYHFFSLCVCGVQLTGHLSHARSRCAVTNRRGAYRISRQILFALSAAAAAALHRPSVRAARITFYTPAPTM